jgi:hypothetical protein
MWKRVGFVFYLHPAFSIIVFSFKWGRGANASKLTGIASHRMLESPEYRFAFD